MSNPLYQNLGYAFKNPMLLETALRHRSVAANNNERLEFLGDSILNFIIAEALFLREPSMREGKLSRIRSSLVREETLAELAHELSLGDFLVLGPGELKSGGFRRGSILADALEAVIGAIYLDSDFNTCQQLVLRWFKTRLEKIVEANEDHKDPKTELQEYLQCRRLPLPSYAVGSITGEAHRQEFHIICKVTKLNLMSQGIGASRRKAEQDAAKQLLALIKEQS